LAGRTPHEALSAFVDPLQRALSCVTQAVLVHRKPWPGHVQALGVSEEPIGLRCTTGSPAPWLYVEQQYDLIEVPGERGPWKVSTLAYRYRIDSAAGDELALWHWHPKDRQDRPHRYPYPHLHAQAGQLTGLHLPTGRVSVESVLRLLLNEFDVQPRRDDWADVLAASEAAFERWRTWPAPG
jgi:hypothetical protein